MQSIPPVELKINHNFIDGMFRVMFRCFLSREFFYVINLEIINNIDGMFRVTFRCFISREFFYVINLEIINNTGVPSGPSIKLSFFLISWENFLYGRCSG